MKNIKLKLFSIFWIIVLTLMNVWQITNLVNTDTPLIPALWIVANTLWIVNHIVKLSKIDS